MALSSNVKIALDIEVANSTKDVTALDKSLKSLTNSLDSAKAGTKEYTAIQNALAAGTQKYNTLTLDAAIANANNAKTIGELNKAMKQLKVAQESVDKSSPDFKKLSDAINKTEGRVGDLNDSFKTLTGSGIERLNSSLGLLKDGLLNADPEKMTIGMDGLKEAMAALPIFLLIEGLKYLYDNFDKIVAIFSDTEDSLKKNQKAFEDLTTEVNLNKVKTDSLIITKQIELKALERQGKSLAVIILKMKEINKLKQDNFRQDLKLTDKELNNQIAKINDLKNKIENKSETESLLQFFGIDAGATKEDLDKATSELVAMQIKRKQITNDAVVSEAAGEDEIQAKKDEAADKEKDRLKKQKDEAKKAKDEINKILDDGEKNYQARIKAEDDAKKKLEDDKVKLENDAFEAENALMLKNLADRQGALKNEIDNTENSYVERNQLADDYYQGLIQKAHDNGETTYQLEQEYTKKKLDLSKQESDQKKKDIDDVKKAKEEADKESIANEQAAFNAASSLSDTIFQIKANNAEAGSEAQKKALENQFKVDKAFNITKAVIDGIRSVQAALTLPPPASYVMAAINGVTAAASIAKIASQKFNPGSTGGSTAVNIPRPSASSANAAINTAQSNPLIPSQLQKVGGGLPKMSSPGSSSSPGGSNSTVVKAVVVSSDVTKSQDADAVIKRRTSF